MEDKIEISAYAYKPNEPLMTKRKDIDRTRINSPFRIEQNDFCDILASNYKKEGYSWSIELKISKAIDNV